MQRNFFYCHILITLIFYVVLFLKEGRICNLLLSNDRKAKIIFLAIFIKSVNSIFTLAVHSPKLNQAKRLTFCLIWVKKNKAILWFESMISGLEVYLANHYSIGHLFESKCIYVTNIVMRQKVSLGLIKFWWVYCQSKIRINSL